MSLLLFVCLSLHCYTFIMNNRDTLFAFLIPMIVYIGSAVFAFLKHGDEFELLILAGVSGVLAVISLILAIASPRWR